MATVARTGSISFEEFCLRIGPDQKADLIDGIIYMASPESLEANALFLWLVGVFLGFVDAEGLGRVYGSRVAFRLGKTQGPEPDIAFVRQECMHLARKTFFAGPPDLALEIVSPESVDRDYVKKRALYQKAGVREYWIVDPDLRKVSLLRLSSAGKYREVRPARGVLRSEVLPGFWLRPEWLWQQPRPSQASVLDQILQDR
jgi:Uma2 family endonuclease